MAAKSPINAGFYGKLTEFYGPFSSTPCRSQVPDRLGADGLGVSVFRIDVGIEGGVSLRVDTTGEIGSERDSWHGCT